MKRKRSKNKKHILTKKETEPRTTAKQRNPKTKHINENKLEKENHVNIEGVTEKANNKKERKD